MCLCVCVCVSVCVFSFERKKRKSLEEREYKDLEQEEEALFKSMQMKTLTSAPGIVSTSVCVGGVFMPLLLVDSILLTLH